MDRLSNLKIESYGPNCWNSALLVSGLTDAVHYTDQSEFWLWMNSPYCKALPPESQLEYGDIGSVFSAKSGHFHSFMRINDDTLFQKAGPESSLTWGTDKYESILFPQFFSEATRCKGNESTMAKKGCAFQVIYHRCQPIPSDFYSRHRDMTTLLNNIKSAENRLLAWMKADPSISKEDYYAEIEKLAPILESLLAMRFTGQKEFARKALAFRVAGLIFTDVNNHQNHPPKVQRAMEDAQKLFSSYPEKRDFVRVSNP